MKKDNYLTCLVKMELFEEFNHYGNNMMGIESFTGKQLIKYYEADYWIFSYDTIICFVNFRDKTYCINPTKYSITTSRQVGLIYRATKVWESRGFERILWI